MSHLEPERAQRIAAYAYPKDKFVEQPASGLLAFVAITP
jgi:hypothetical protein